MGRFCSVTVLFQGLICCFLLLKKMNSSCISNFSLLIMSYLNLPPPVASSLWQWFEFWWRDGVRGLFQSYLIQNEDFPWNLAQIPRVGMYLGWKDLPRLTICKVGSWQGWTDPQNLWNTPWIHLKHPNQPKILLPSLSSCSNTNSDILNIKTAQRGKSSEQHKEN